MLSINLQLLFLKKTEISNSESIELIISKILLEAGKHKL